VIGPESLQGLIDLFAELHLSAMSIRISREPGDRSPIEIQNAKIVHRPSVLIHTSAKDFPSPSVIELSIKVREDWAGESIDIRSVHILDALVSS